MIRYKNKILTSLVYNESFIFFRGLIKMVTFMALGNNITVLCTLAPFS